MNHQIAIIGLGYVGLPLARLFATRYPVVGFDINQHRIGELRAGTDSTLEVSDELLQSVLLPENPFTDPAPDTSHLASGTLHPGVPTDTHGSSSAPATQPLNHSTTQPLNHSKPGLYCSSSPQDIAAATTYIITVPTPVDKNNRPDLTPLYKASETVGQVLKKGDIVIYESTVYPGATEEECIPVLEKVSGLKFNQDFFAGYSPERINPGDKEHTVEKILKVTSGSTPEIGKVVDDLYKSVITAGTHLAPTIKVAEAAKVIENSQRDINIAFVNELAKIFNLMDIDTHAVLEAAGTKWNFLPFRPGLVGGHCIGVDPYYLAQKAQEYGYHPEIILAGRRLNDSMGGYIASQVVKAMIRKDISINGSRVLMLGITFKENCPDVRNTKIVDVIAALEDYGVQVDIYDPWANAEEVKHEYGLTLTSALPSTLTSALPSTSTHQFECPPMADVSRTECPPTADISTTDSHSKTSDFRLPTSALSAVKGSDSSLPTPDSQLPTQYDAIILGVAHKEFLSLDLSLYLKPQSVLYDVKGILDNADNTL